MATNAYRAAQAQVEALAVPIPQTWDYLWAEYQDIKQEADELGERVRPLAAKAKEEAVKRIGPRRKGETLDESARYSERYWAIAEEVAPGVQDLERKWDDIRDFLLDLEGQLVLTPAPDAEALLFKMNWIWAHELENKGSTHTDCHPLVYVRAILMDARRLLSGEA
jgi:hypothetical protein